MKLLLLFFLFSVPAFAQENDSLTGPVNVVDGVYLSHKPWCTYDSTVKLHQNATFAIADSNILTYTFKTGNKTYLEITLHTLKCRCSDCESSNQLIIDISDLPDSGELTLSRENLIWFSWHSWIRPKTETNIGGTLIMKGGQVSLKAFAYYDPLHRAVRNEVKLDLPVKQP